MAPPQLDSLNNRMENIHINKSLLGALYFVWIIPVVNFILNPNYNPSAWPVWVAMGATILISFGDRRIIPLAIPFVALLSPLAYSSRVFGLLPSDFFLVYGALSLLLIVMFKTDQFKVLAGDVYLIWLLPAALVSYLLSFEYEVLFPSLLNWIALIIVFLITRTVLRAPNLVPIYYLSLLVTATYASALIIAGFASGMPLASFTTDSDTERVFLDKENLNYLFRASYFYTNIMYVLGSAVIVLLVTILTSRKIISKIISIGLLIVILLTLFLMFAKTALVALAICFLAILTLLSFSPGRLAQKHGGFVRPLFIIFPSVFLLFIVSQLVGSANNYTLNTDSLTARLDVVSSSFNVLLQHPERFVFGFGPDASIRISNEATDAARSSDGGVEGAIDSAYVAFLFEYGLIFLILFLLFGVRSLLQLFRLIRQSHQVHPILITQFVVLIFIYTAAVSQVISTSKVAWIVSQIFALTGICLSRNIHYQHGMR